MDEVLSQGDIHRIMPSPYRRSLTACPFCGGSRLSTVTEDGCSYVLCDTCGGRGPACLTGSDAQAGWQRSASPQLLIRELIDATPSMVLVVDQHERYLLVNKAVGELFNCPVEDIIGRCVEDFVTQPEVLEFTRNSIRQAFTAKGVMRVDETLYDPSRRERSNFVTLKKQLLFGPDKIPAVLLIATDVTALKRANREIAEREKRYIEAMAASGEGIWELDLRNLLIAHNSHLPEIYGFDASYFEVSANFLFDRIHPDDRAWVRESFTHAMETDGEYESQHRVVRDDGSTIWIRNRARVAERDEDGAPLRVIGSTRDITQRKQAEANLEEARRELERTNNQLENLVEERTSELVQLNLELQSLARRDSLTGLANRLAADEHLLQEFARFRRHNQPYTVMLADVDHFKQVNDTFGHPVGDKALMHVANLLRTNLRETDLVARYGGEEFLLLVQTQDTQTAQQLAEGIRRLVEVTPVSAGLSLTISIGVSAVEDADTDATDALRRADKLLYRAKAEGRNCIRS
ncbi:diguanylate cyclase [Thalassolituus sp. LLYu03]|uniref:diguanylate cyclase n=1 Tax=Thalassolituus sp. LLYu03 TaxID=3421656 RepID=UPI003D270B29